MKVTLLFLVLFIYSSTANGKRNPPNLTAIIHPNHMVEQIPRLKKMPDNFNMFSGHLHAKNVNKKFYYWLNEVEENRPENKTLLIWLNGGPGCSSLYGLFKENGPITFSEKTRRLTPNPYSWNKFAHTLYIEAPVDVGYSYREKVHSLQENPSDHNTVEDLLAALDDFYDVHARYRDFDVYLTGESYAGVYIPLMTLRALKRNNTYLAQNLKGIVLGNPSLITPTSTSRIRFFHQKGIITDEIFAFFNKYDCLNETARELLNAEELEKCYSRYLEYRLKTEVRNVYNVEEKCFTEMGSTGSIMQQQTAMEQQNMLEKALKTKKAAMNRQTRDVENEDGMTSDEYKKAVLEFEATEICDEHTNMEAYMNRRRVQNALHARHLTEKPLKWKACNTEIFTTYVRKNKYMDMTPQIKKIIKKYNIPMLVYYGDLDSVCNYLDGEDFVKNLNFEQTKERKDITMNNGNDVITTGYEEEYANKLTMAVIKGAGHMVPKDKPAEIYHLVQSWIQSH